MGRVASYLAVLVTTALLDGCASHPTSQRGVVSGRESVIDVQRLAGAFEKELAQYRGRFGELRDFPARKVDEPNEVVWELNEVVEYANGMTAGAGSRPGPGRIILRLEPPPDAERIPQRMAYSSSLAIFFHVDSANRNLQELAARVLASIERQQQ